jgi:heme/copper-type cytochrome/quinol oxidase subunit 2
MMSQVLTYLVGFEVFLIVALLLFFVIFFRSRSTGMSSRSSPPIYTIGKLDIVLVLGAFVQVFMTDWMSCT